MSVIGATPTHPAQAPDSAELVKLINQADVTVDAPVPTVWINVLQYLREECSSADGLDRVLTGGSAVPVQVMREYKAQHDVRIEHAWAMPETMSAGSFRDRSPGGRMRNSSIYGSNREFFLRGSRCKSSMRG